MHYGACVEFCGRWLPAKLSDELGDTPVVLVAGENTPRGVEDVFYLRARAETGRGRLSNSQSFL